MSKEWDAITYDELYDLFCVKSFPDSMIANMYNVEKKEVTKKRRKWDITQMGGVLDSIFKELAKQSTQDDKQ
ncbi:hypothetical protein [Cellulosilyticum lentocellum]|uniref:Uncharacterized protein n=1 Tax=Cellulosilyticum lentocellum (strain ATCC 49066 / DSM 5427 / NCIMB 11756 / RHM5) TaxID=642492 RepID=F2JSR7_CELLD|nr:hypothetical protein [Cellulosilyticum lentocellum]ADZ82901.1 hypothetical protein Clole_1172 [Cellulosilyticum lentocellum DSM 5427]